MLHSFSFAHFNIFDYIAAKNITNIKIFWEGKGVTNEVNFTLNFFFTETFRGLLSHLEPLLPPP